MRIGFDEYQLVGPNELMVMANLKQHELTALYTKTRLEAEATCYDEAAFKRVYQLPSIRKLIANTFLMRSQLVLPLSGPAGESFAFYFYSRRPDAYQEEHVALLSQLTAVLMSAVANKLNVNQSLTVVVPPTESIAPPPSDSYSSLTTFEGIVDSSHLLLTVFDHLSLVVPTCRWSG